MIMNTKRVSIKSKSTKKIGLNTDSNSKKIAIEYEVFIILKKKNYRVGFCESCTGGLISSRFSRIPGVSEIFDRSIITYSNISKVEEVGVKVETLETFGAVSKETALEMANGLLIKSKNLDIVLSITGIAGPSSNLIDRPIGLVYICISTKDKSKIIKCNFSGNREDIQNKAATRAFLELKNFLLNI